MRAEAVPGYGLLWIDDPGLTPEAVAAGAGNDPLRYVLNVSTTGDLAAELTSGQEALDEPDAELPLLDLQLDQLAGQVTATALLAREGDQRRLDERFGAGAVR